MISKGSKSGSQHTKEHSVFKNSFDSLTQLPCVGLFYLNDNFQKPLA
jgi:hypothetical protein